MERTNNAVIDRPTNVFGTEGNATDYFAFKEYRKYQKKIIDKIERAFEYGYRYVVLDAPVGSGKSVIGYSFARQSGAAHILTIQKLLQDQYKRDFKDAFIMKGRGSYRCVRSGGVFSCADGLCKRKRIKKCSDCPYIVARSHAESSPITVHNFDSFYWTNLMGKGYAPRNLLIIDECHNIPGKYADFLSFTVSSTPQYEIPEFDDIRDYTELLKNIRDDSMAELNMIDSLRDAMDGLDTENVKREAELRKTLVKLNRYLLNLERKDSTEYVFDYKSNGKYGGKVTFKPLYVADFIKDGLFRYGDKVLLMSATILSSTMFCREVGLDPEEVYYLKVPSTFPTENHPIWAVNSGSMSMRNIQKTLPKMLEAIKKILKEHPNDKGIIQTHSEKIANYIKSNLHSSRLLFNKDFNDPYEMLEVHKLKPNSIIVASGLREGLDLYGDLSKVQIFCKVPYPSLGDKWVKRRLELNPVWYGYATTLMFVQAIGRSIRSVDDEVDTYILDSDFGYYYKRNKQFIPDYIRESIIWSRK